MLVFASNRLPLLTRSFSLFQRNMSSLKIVSPVPSDIEIAQSVDPVVINDVAAKVCCFEPGIFLFFFFFQHFISSFYFIFHFQFFTSFSII